jgi:hypothetical protein
MDTPTLSQLQAYTTDHFTAGVPVISEVARHGDSIFRQQNSDLATMGWTGEGADAATARVGGDAKLVSATSGQLHAMVSDIRTAQSRADQAHNEVMSYIGSIPKDYEVSENLTVTAKPTSGSSYLQAVRQVRAAEITSELGAKVSAFMATETATQAKLSGHAATLGGVNFPGWKPPHYDDPNHGHYNPDYPTPATPYEASHHGGNFNDQVKIDTSHAESRGDTGQEWLETPVRPDWPMPLGLASRPTGDVPAPGPFIIPGMPPVPPGAGIQQGITDGSRFGLPVLTPHPVNQPPPPMVTNGYNPTGGRITMVDNTTNPWTDPGGVWDQNAYAPAPVTPLLPPPPVMTAMPPDEYMEPMPKEYFDHRISPGSVIAGAGMGCFGGMGGAAGLLALTGPGEIAAPVACAIGIPVGMAGAVLGPAFDNSLHGAPWWDAIQFDTGS